LGTGDDVEKDQLRQNRNKFYTEILVVEFTGYKDNEEVQARFTKNEAVAISNFFCNGLVGPPTLNRLSSLVVHHITKVEGLLDREVAVRAHQLAT
jgi:hypothetical protein